MIFTIEQNEAGEQILRKGVPEPGDTELRIPRGIRWICGSAFEDCRWDRSKLRRVVFPADGPYTIEAGTFMYLPIEEAVINGPVIQISGAAFACCESLRKVTVLSAVEKIGDLYTGGFGAFEGCDALEEVVLPEPLYLLGPNTFSLCENLREITLPESLNVIGADAFMGSGLKRVRIPDNVQYIGSAAFAACEELEEAYIPDSVTELEKRVFDECPRLKRVSVPYHLRDAVRAGGTELIVRR